MTEKFYPHCEYTARLSEGLKKLVSADFIALDTADVPPEFLEAYGSFNKLSAMLREVLDFSKALARGNVSASPPPRQNYLAMGLKNIHSQLLHVIWQAEQIAAGDYNQSIDFMGDFGKTFNWAVENLRKRREENEAHRAMLLDLFDSLQSAIILIDDTTEKSVFHNKAAEEICKGHTDLAHEKREGLMTFLYKLCKNPPPAGGKVFLDTRTKRWYKITMAETHWNENQHIKIFNCMDLTKEQFEYEQAKEAAFDALTGLATRNMGLPKIEELFHKLPQGAELCLVFFDLDGLKRVNDTLGHAAGDDFIIRFSNALKQTFRAGDVLVRMGGDEFVAAFIAREEKIIGEILTRFAENVRHANTGRAVLVEYSFGYCTSSHESPVSVARMIEQADSLMYEHKKARKAAKGMAVEER